MHKAGKVGPVFTTVGLGAGVLRTAVLEPPAFFTFRRLARLLYPFLPLLL